MLAYSSGLAVEQIVSQSSSLEVWFNDCVK